MACGETRVAVSCGAYIVVVVGNVLGVRFTTARTNGIGRKAVCKAVAENQFTAVYRTIPLRWHGRLRIIVSDGAPYSGAIFDQVA